MAKINLDTSLTAKLREKVNEYQHYSITKTHSIKKMVTDLDGIKFAQ